MNDPLFTAAVVAAGLVTAAVSSDTIVPLDQDRHTSVQVQTRCGGETSDGEAAVAFEPFDSAVGALHDCPDEPTLAAATANQTSEIGGSSMLVVAVAHVSAHSPGSVFVSAVSNFAVTFELPRASVISFEGLLLGSGSSGGVQGFLRLTGREGDLLDEVLAGPFPPGEATKLLIDEDHIVEAGAYTVHGQALVAEAIDIAEPIYVAESDLTVVIDVTVLGDTDGDEIVDVEDLINVILCWGTSGAGCPGPGDNADVNRDGAVDVDDLITVVLAFGP